MPRPRVTGWRAWVRWRRGEGARRKARNTRGKQAYQSTPIRSSVRLYAVPKIVEDQTRKTSRRLGWRTAGEASYRCTGEPAGWLDWSVGLVERVWSAGAGVARGGVARNFKWVAATDHRVVCGARGATMRRTLRLGRSSAIGDARLSDGNAAQRCEGTHSSARVPPPPLSNPLFSLQRNRVEVLRGNFRGAALEQQQQRWIRRALCATMDARGAHFFRLRRSRSVRRRASSSERTSIPPSAVFHPQEGNGGGTVCARPRRGPVLALALDLRDSPPGLRARERTNAQVAATFGDLRPSVLLFS